MDMIQVASSNIAAIGYDEDSATLQIEFHNGGTYQYFEVPQREFDSLQQSDSVGKYLAAHIKGVYRFSRV